MLVREGHEREWFTPLPSHVFLMAFDIMVTFTPSRTLCRVTVFVFAAIPTGFSVVYAHTFSDHVSLKWYQVAWLILTVHVDAVDRNE